MNLLSPLSLSPAYPPAYQQPWSRNDTAALLLVLVVALLYSLAYLSTGISIPDTARDIMFANRIASGSDFVTYGPILNKDFRMGPIWFYWLAIPALSQSAAAIAVWVGFSASSKFIFAFLIGRRLHSTLLGLLFALMLLMPSWNQFELIVFSHTNMVAACSLIFCYLFIVFVQTQDLRLLKWQALWFALALHAHPTAVGIVLLPLGYAIVQLLRGKIPLHTVLVSLLFFMLPFLPYLYLQFSQGFPLLNQLEHSRHDSYFSLTRLRDIPAIFATVFYQGPLSIFMLIRDASSALNSQILQATYGLTVLLVSLGLIRYGFTHRVFLSRPALLLIGFGLLAAAVLMKSVTAFYMMFAVTLFVAFILALGLYALPLRPVFRLTMALLLATSSLLFTWQAVDARNTQDWGYFYNAILADVKQAPEQRDSPPHLIDGYLARNNEVIGDFICQQSQTQQLQGPFLTLLELTLGVTYTFSCPRQQLNQARNQHYALLNQSVLESLNIPVKQRVGGYGVVAVDSVIHADGFQLSQIEENYHHPLIKEFNDSKPIDWQESATLPAGGYLIISHLYPYNFAFPDISIQTITPNQPIGQAKLVYENMYTKIYQNVSDDPQIWQIVAQQVAAQTINLITVRGQPLGP